MKYKYSPIIIIVLLIIVSILNKNDWRKDKAIYDNLMSNNIKFSGIITDFKISKNHDFGIITLKIIESNSENFDPIIDDKLYPYAIRDSVAEIYGTVSYNLKKGDLVEVDSNSQEVVFSNVTGVIYSDQISILSEETNIEFVKKTSTLIK